MICLRDPLLPLVRVSGSQEAGIGQNCLHPPPLKDFSCLLSVKLILWGTSNPLGPHSFSWLSLPLLSRSQGERERRREEGGGAHILLVMYRQSRTYGCN